MAHSHHPPAALDGDHGRDIYCREPACDNSAAVRIEGGAAAHRQSHPSGVTAPTRTADAPHPFAVLDARFDAGFAALGWDARRSLCPECSGAAAFYRGLRSGQHDPVPEGVAAAARERLSAVVGRNTDGSGPPHYLLAERLPGMLGGLESEPRPDPWAVAIRFEMLYALAEGDAHGLYDLPRAVVERIAEVSDPSRWLASSQARWLYTSRAIAATHHDDLSEAVWDGVALEAERAMHALVAPMLDEHART